MAPNVSPAHPQHAVAESRQAPAPLLPPPALSRPRNAAKPTAKGFLAVAPAPIKIWGEGGGGRSCHQQPHGCSSYSVAAGGSAPHAGPCSNTGAAPMRAQGYSLS